MLLDRIKAITEQIALENGVNLYDVEMKNTDKGKVLRVFITRNQGGVTLSDCSRVSRQMSRELDVIDLIANRYFLEVSSPGLERALKRKEHYEHALGEQVKVTYHKDEKNVTETGLLKEVTEDEILLEQEKKQDKKEKKKQGELHYLSVPFDKIKKARTVYVFKGK